MLLEIRDVAGAYHGIRAVTGLTFTVAPGQALAVIGRNGAGKTTTLRLLAGAIHPAAGQIQGDGEDLTGLPARRRVALGITLVPEGRGIFPALSVEENLRMGAYSHRPKPRACQTQLEEIYELLPLLADRRAQRGGSLSGGEQQMLAIGRGLMSRPSLLLLDEPSWGLSPSMTDRVYELLADLHREKGIGLVVVEQYVHLAMELCDAVIGLKKGRIVLTAPSDDVDDSALAELYVGDRTSPAGTETVTVP